MKIKMSEEKKEQITERVEIENTPFVAVKFEEQNWTITMGRFILLNGFESKEAAVKAAKNDNWELILSVMNAVITFRETLKEN